MENNKLTKLPEEWCVKVTNENKHILSNWRTAGGFVSDGYITGKAVEPLGGLKGTWKKEPYNYTEITFEQFKKWVLKENTNQNIPEYVKYIDTKYKGKIVKVEAWLNGSYCKVIFADGTKEQPFKHLVEFSNKEEFDSQNNQPVFEKGKWYKDNKGNYIKYDYFIKNDHFCSEWIDIKKRKHYENGGGTSANLPEIDIQEIQQFLPDGHPDKITKKEFKKDDYIVLLKGEASKSFPLNYCYKQKEDYKYLTFYLDNKGSSTNGWTLHPFDKSKDNDWRYATPEEIAEYDRLGKPFDVSTLKKKLTLDDLLEEGKVYCVGEIVIRDHKQIYLIKHKSNLFVNIDSKIINKREFTYFPDQTYTTATPEQIKHYEACVIAGEYVEPDSIEKVEPWSVGTYVVIIKEYHSVKIGEVHKICKNDDSYVDISESVGKGCLPFKSSVKWFATKQEAEEFSKTLTETEDNIPEYVECIEQNYYYDVLGKIYKVINWNYGHEDCMLEGINTGSTNRDRFKPSTKEAYEAQNKQTTKKLSENDEIKVGDKVVLIKRGAVKNESVDYSAHLELNKLYTCISVKKTAVGGDAQLCIRVKEDTRVYFHPIIKFRKALPHEISTDNKPMIKEPEQQFIKGEWYVNKDLKSAGALKLLEFKKGKFYYSERIFSDSSYRKEEGEAFWYPENVLKISIDKISQYLPNSQDFNSPLKTNNVLLIDTIIQPKKVETISDKIMLVKIKKVII